MKQKKEKGLSKIDQRKKVEESGIVLTLLRYLGLSAEQLNSDDVESPDFRLNMSGNSLIGVEVTHYVATANKEIQSALDKFFCKYIQHLNKITSIPYDIDVSFWSIDYPSFHIKNNQEKIIEELDSFIPGRIRKVKTQFIADAVFEVSYDDVSHVNFCPMIEFEDVNSDALMDCIHEKEILLKEYMSNPNNSHLTEYWLVINFGIEERGNMENFQLPDTFNTKYDRVYFVDKTSNIKVKRAW